MSSLVRDGRFDVAIVAGPRVEHWPTQGTRILSLLCAEMGLTVGIFGGETMTVRGVLPSGGTGGLVVIEDLQQRIHRIFARAVVKVTAEAGLPDPFPGWLSQGLIPLATATRLRESEASSEFIWDPATAILGTGNRALRFGSALLESGAREVICVESFAQWGAKRFSGWEVERRRFEQLGGKVTEARPVRLSPKSPLIWELRLQDAQGIRVLEVARVVSAGPFRDLPGVREHPPGSALFELEQTAAAAKPDDVEGWVFEEERARLLAGRIVRALSLTLGPGREELDRVYTRARGRLKRFYNHRGDPFTPAYQGKWIAATDARKIRSFSGIPKEAQKTRSVASIECFEEIPCNLCAQACPEDAIDIGRVPRVKPVLDESRCTGCGVCLKACPSAATLLIQEKEERSTSQLTLPWRGKTVWRVGEFATLINRRGESLGSARVIGFGGSAAEVPDPPHEKIQLVQVEVPTHLLWDARALRPPRGGSPEDEAYFDAVQRSATAEYKVEVTLNGEKRLVRDDVPISLALFETGRSRPEDTLLCPDGSCGLCTVSVDGVKKTACQTHIHRGMVIRLPPQAEQDLRAQDALCPCLGVTREQVIERMRQGNLMSPEAVLSVVHVGEGKCHGQLCMPAFRRVLLDQGMDVSQWIDWRFPFSEWRLPHN